MAHHRKSHAKRRSATLPCGMHSRVTYLQFLDLFLQVALDLLLLVGVGCCVELLKKTRRVDNWEGTYVMHLGVKRLSYPYVDRFLRFKEGQNGTTLITPHREKGTRMISDYNDNTFSKVPWKSTRCSWTCFKHLSISAVRPSGDEEKEKDAKY